MDTPAHLRQLSQQRHHIPAAHIAYLRRLKASGFEPRTIYDIGACVLHWSREAKEVWPGSRVIAFDALEPAEFLWREEGAEYHLGVLSDVDGRQVRFHQNDRCPTGSSYYREVGASVSAALFPPDGYLVKHAARLDTVVRDRGFPPPDLVKIDVQGSELDVIRGGAAAIACASHLIVELQHTIYNEGAPNATVSLPAIEAMGWRCVAPLFSDNGPDGDYGFEREPEVPIPEPEVPIPVPCLPLPESDAESD